MDLIYQGRWAELLIGPSWTPPQLLPRPPPVECHSTICSLARICLWSSNYSVSRGAAAHARETMGGIKGMNEGITRILYIF